MHIGIRRSLQAGKEGRSWRNLVGYTLVQLQRRLTRTMPTGYSWADFLAGRLHIDHKIPVAVFRFTSVDDVDFKRCWALKNLQLLPAEVNRRKNATLSEPFQPSLL
jgi:hypothetical protein